MPHDSIPAKTEDKQRRRIAFVDGDVTEDWNIATYRGPDDRSLWHKQNEKVPFAKAEGGAVLLAKLIREMAAVGHLDWEVVCRSVEGRKLPKLYTVWYPYESQPKPVWRINKFLGSEPAADSPVIDLPLSNGQPPEIIVIDDKGHEFRQDPAWWSDTLDRSNSDTWFLIRAGRPLVNEGMWQDLNNRKANVMAVVTADDVRRREVFVSRRLSWERTAQDLIEETLKPALSQFEGCAFLIVCFTASAVVVVEKRPAIGAAPDKSTPRSWLIYDPCSLENEEWRDASKGRIYGYTYCIIAAITSYLFSRLPESPDAQSLTNAIKKGLTASRNLYQEGFELQGDGIAFPITRIVNELKADNQEWGVVQIPQRDPENDAWTLFETQAESEGRTLEDIAKEIVTAGADELVKRFPFYEVGDLMVADRREIEGYRNIQRLMREYAMPRPARRARPLSVAVFGQPGSGKSYGIQQLAQSDMGGVRFAPLTFNLSQMTSPDELKGAFHQVRDKALSGEVPLVFWDEFDYPLGNKELGWLRFFLAPMQDGKFSELQIEHFIGRAIFVFAGGINETFDDFCKDIDSASARQAKTPDFVSRLRGYLNIRGVNPLPSEAEDKLYIVRRAILFRSHLKNIAPSLCRDNERALIDPGVLNAFLRVNKYRHGARSMEAVISMSLLAGLDRFERSGLPSPAQLSLHVDANDFIRLLNET
jgi:hypothetical protein